MSKRPTFITPSAAKLSQAPLGEKEKLRSELQSLQPEIERVATQSAERRKLEATVEQTNKVAQENRKPWLEREIAVPTGKFRREQKAKRTEQKLAEISVQLTKQRENAQRRAPLDNTPTPERIAKLAAAEPITPPIADDNAAMFSTTKAHMAQGVVGFYQDKWSHEELQGARYLVRVYDEAAAGEPGMTAAYDGMPVTAAMMGPRSGGSRAADKHRTWLGIEGVMRMHFGAKGVQIARWFVWETQRVAKEGATLGDQMVAAGRALAPFVKDEGRLWGLTMGWLQAMFRFSYGHWVVPDDMERDRSSKQGGYRERLNAKGMGAEQLQREVDKEIAATPKGLRLVKGSSTP